MYLAASAATTTLSTGPGVSVIYTWQSTPWLPPDGGTAGVREPRRPHPGPAPAWQPTPVTWG